MPAMPAIRGQCFARYGTNVISSDEDDIWNYTSQKRLSQPRKDSRRKKKVKTETVIKHENDGKPNLKAVTKRRKSKQKSGGSIASSHKLDGNVAAKIKAERTPSRKSSDQDRSGRCPVCQMPFTALSLVETPRWHVDDCQLTFLSTEKNDNNAVECPQGTECGSTIASHYKRFKHTELARSLRKSQSEATSSRGNVDSAKVKLNFDSCNQLFLPGASADCAITLDMTSPLSSSQRSGDMLIDDNHNGLIESDQDMFKEGLDEEVNDKAISKCKMSVVGEVIHKSNKPDAKGDSLSTGSICASSQNCQESHVPKKNAGNIEMESYESYSISSQSDDEGYEEFVEESETKVSEKETGVSEKSVCNKNDIMKQMFDSDSQSKDAAENRHFIFNENKEFIASKLTDHANTSNSLDIDVKLEDAGSVSINSQSFIRKVQVDELIVVSSCDSIDDINDLDESKTLTQMLLESEDEQHDIAKEPVKHSEEEIQNYEPSSAIKSLSEDSDSDDLDILKNTLTQSSFLYSKIQQTDGQSSKKSKGKDDPIPLSYTVTVSERAADEEARCVDEINVVENANGFSEENDYLNENDNQYNKKSEENESTTDSDIGFFAKKMCKPLPTDSDTNDVNAVKPDGISASKQCDLGESTSNHTVIDTDMYSNIKSKSSKTTHKPRTNNICTRKADESEKKSISKASAENVNRSRKRKGETKHSRTVKTEKRSKVKRKLDNHNQKDILSFFMNVKKEDITIISESSSGEDTGLFNGKTNCCSKCLNDRKGPVMKNIDQDSPCSCSQELHQSVMDKSVSGQGNKAVGITNNDELDEHTFIPLRSSCKTPTVFTDDSSMCSGNSLDKQKRRPESSPSRQNSRSPASNLHEISCSRQSSKSPASTSHESGRSTQRSNSPALHWPESANSRQSSKTPEFEIGNFCTVSQTTYRKLQLNSTLSQNTFARLDGGFIPDDNDGEINDDAMTEVITSDEIAGDTAGESEYSSSEQNPSALLNYITGKVSVITKNAADILMASSKFLYGQGASSQSAQNAKTVNEVLMKTARKLPKLTVGQDNGQKPSAGSRKGWKQKQGHGNSESGDQHRRVLQCPFYKKIPGTSFTVDAFRYGLVSGCRVYFLSHFHYDHYAGLTKKFTGNIYCSKVTGNLVARKLGVDRRYIHTLDMHVPTVIEGTEVTLLEANHCPGAALILFKLKERKVYLHTGDFRACREMESYPELQNLRVSSLYLDTTYCDPQYLFPPQSDVIQFTVKLAREVVHQNPKTLVVCGSYTIGKERIFVAIAEALDCRICVTSDKKTVLDCLEDVELSRRSVVGWTHSRLHVLPMNKLKYQGLKDHLRQHGRSYDRVLAFEPTGWTHSKKKIALEDIKPKFNKDGITLYGVPYSEHSSYLEMKRFVQYVRPDKILPTVNNGNVHSRRNMEVIFQAWREESVDL
ncbi:DNA cross-link repair 1A protein-like isoform X1 [Mya arenaria]|uniref:DNA cross-link repair 1A protein-like isoform X1 n=1 Tax=Mya arenaria TaxID=6604 RepID=UPI0022E10CF3|nr:DNA cross-link repair 1A protein-like isoform X1 [Mya arenaria]